jgi:trk system potassium uptake protein TrkH
MSLRYAAFQVISVGTTTGFATTDTASWPVFTILVLIYFTIQCACVGSTSGGLKFDRVFIFFKSLGSHIRKIQHPRAVIITRIGNKVVTENMEHQTSLFILLYLTILFIVTLVLTALNIDLITAFSA